MVTNFNTKYFKNVKFDVSKILVGSNQNMIMIRAFDDKRDAMNYYNMIQKQSTLDPSIKEGVYLITNKNLRTLFKEKNIEAYAAFFNSKYF